MKRVAQMARPIILDGGYCWPEFKYDHLPSDPATGVGSGDASASKRWSVHLIRPCSHFWQSGNQRVNEHTRDQYWAFERLWEAILALSVVGGHPSTLGRMTKGLERQCGRCQSIQPWSALCSLYCVHYVTMCYIVLHYVAVCYSVLKCVKVC